MAPKRPADSYASSTASSSSSKPSTSTNAGGKRVKFDATADAPATSTDGGAIEADLEDDLTTGSAAHRNKVVTDGYDSDSSADGSDDGFGGVGGGRKGAKKATTVGNEDDDDDDMFGELDKDDKKDVPPLKKQKDFLEMGDIEGQEFGKGDDEDREEGSVDEEDEEEYALEDDLANNDDAPRSRRSKKGMGYQLSSFNMAEELNEGRFAADGTYVRNNDDPLATHDVWLDGVSKAAIKAARESKKRMDENAKRREEQEARGDEAVAQQRDDCMIGLLKLLREGETVTMALNRLGRQRKKVAKKVVKPKIQDGDEAMELDETPSEIAAGKQKEENEDPAVKKIDQITLLASTLLAQGELEIYDTSYDQIIKTLKEEGAVRRDWEPPVDPDIAKEQAEAAAAGGARRGIIARPTAAVTARPSAAQAPPPPPPPSTSTAAGKKFFYKWKVPQAGQPADQEYGPFGQVEIEQWIAGGFLGPNGSNIVVRVEGQGGKAWTSWSEAKL